jgi:hypothetical protein
MDKGTQLWHEYQTLRDEMKGADSLNYQIIGIVVGAVVALLTTGFKETNPGSRLFIFFSIYVVTVPGLRLLQGNRRRIWRISTYMRVFLEPQLQFINWETRLDRQRQHAQGETERQHYSSLAITNEWFIISMLNIAAFVAIFWGLIQMNASIALKLFGIIAIALANWWRLYKTYAQEKEFRRLGRIEQSFLKSWLEIRESEQHL